MAGNAQGASCSRLHKNSLKNQKGLLLIRSLLLRLMAWACMPVNRTVQLVFINDVIADKSSRKTFSSVYMAICSAQVQLNVTKLTGWCFTVQMDSNHTSKAT